MNKNSDTLYFVAEENAKSGQLYLGSQLISWGNSESELTAKTKLSELTDVLVGEGLTNGSLLVYNTQMERWTAEPIEEVLNSTFNIMVGATETTNGMSGFVPVPTYGVLNRFLKVDGTWADTGVDNLQSQISTLVADDTGKTVRNIATDVLIKSLVPDDAQASLDSLKQIADWIASYPDSAGKMNSDIKDLQTDVSGLHATVGNFISMNIDGTTYSNITDVIKINTDNISDINERLSWRAMDSKREGE